MNKQYSVFQMVIFGIFAFFIIAAVFVFAGLGGGENSGGIGVVEMWGTIDQDLMDEYLTELNETDKRAGNVKYYQIPEESLQSELIEALAENRGPDLFLLEQSYILRHWNKMYRIPYDYMDRRTYMDTFIDEAQLYLSEKGMFGLPFTVDPLVLYWNRDIFSSSGFSKPPKYWDELILMAQKMTIFDSEKNIKQSAIAFGTFDNVTHAKDILATLIMQKGGEIVGRTASGVLYSALEPDGEGFASSALLPTQAIMRSYTEFSNPVKSFYTWNSALPESIDMFAQGRLGMYIGYASELSKIQAKNPNLNFDVAVLPQIRSGSMKRTLTFGRMHAFAIPNASDNKYGATQIAFFLSDTFASRMFAKIHHSSSPRRDVLSQRSTDVLEEIFRMSSLLASAWLDPYPEKTNKIFRSMVKAAISGKLQFSEAVHRANIEMRILLEQ